MTTVAPKKKRLGGYRDPATGKHYQSKAKALRDQMSYPQTELERHRKALVDASASFLRSNATRQQTNLVHARTFEHAPDEALMAENAWAAAALKEAAGVIENALFKRGIT